MKDISAEVILSEAEHNGLYYMELLLQVNHLCQHLNLFAQQLKKNLTVKKSFLLICLH